MNFKELVLEKPESLLVDQSIYDLILYNDEVNTFDWVITSLIDVCQHNDQQAEQSALIVHYKGKCTVKSGSLDSLEPRCLALLDRGLSARIE
ncbi:MAG: ATP-dependent Clp protease adaptor ClpS [Sphingobacteriia bacterium]|jgi:ATP-dependent Clp protease adaptor protein ClpS|nr:ATP-dependent Clp protease adaptor ClpS [Sphingobacteriia bacterium]